MRKALLATALLTTILTLTAACSNAEKQEAEIAMRVDATVAAWPTQTPYPTLEPLPTYTPYPTHTPVPTETPTSDQNDPSITNPSPGDVPEELLDELTEILWNCTQNMPDFRQGFIDGVMESGLTEEVAVAILEDKQNFQATVKELAQDEEWLGHPEEIAAVIPMMEYECGTDSTK